MNCLYNYKWRVIIIYVCVVSYNSMRNYYGGLCCHYVWFEVEPVVNISHVLLFFHVMDHVCRWYKSRVTGSKEGISDEFVFEGKPRSKGNQLWGMKSVIQLWYPQMVPHILRANYWSHCIHKIIMIVINICIWGFMLNIQPLLSFTSIKYFERILTRVLFCLWGFVGCSTCTLDNH